MMPTIYTKNGLECVARPIEEFDNECVEISALCSNYGREMIAPLLCEARARFPANQDYGAWMKKYGYFSKHQQTLLRWRTDYENTNEIKYLDVPTNVGTPQPIENVTQNTIIPTILEDADMQPTDDTSTIAGVKEEENPSKAKKYNKGEVKTTRRGAFSPAEIETFTGNAKTVLEKTAVRMQKYYQDDFLKQVDIKVKSKIKEATQQRETQLDEREEKLNILDANLTRQRASLHLVIDENDLKSLRLFCHPDKYQDQETKDKAHKVQLIVQKLFNNYDKGILRDQVANEKKQVTSRTRYKTMMDNAGY